MPKSRFLDQVRDTLRLHQYSYSTERSYIQWIRRFILFHGKVHPRNLAKLEVESFLTHLAVDRKVTPSTQNQALAALIFLYAKVLGVNMPWLDDVVRATSPMRLPVVLTKPEVLRLIEKVAVAQRLVVRLKGVRGGGATRSAVRKTQVCGSRTHVAVCISSGETDRRSTRTWQVASPPCLAANDPTRCATRIDGRGFAETGHDARVAAQLCNSLVGIGSRPSNRARVVRARECQNDSDIYPCTEQTRAWRAQSRWIRLFDTELIGAAGSENSVGRYRVADTVDGPRLIIGYQKTPVGCH